MKRLLQPIELPRHKKNSIISVTLLQYKFLVPYRQRGGAVVARQAHNLKVAGAIPAPATSKMQAPLLGRFAFILLRRERGICMPRVRNCTAQRCFALAKPRA